MLEENQLLVVQKLFSWEAVIQIGSINDCHRTVTILGRTNPWKIQNSNQKHLEPVAMVAGVETTRTPVKAH